MTNPDNVGGLPEPVGWRVRLSERGNNPWGPSPWHLESSEPKPSPREFYDVEQLHTADQMRAYGELCRAATAGGDDGRLSNQDDYTVVDCPHCGTCVQFVRKEAQSLRPQDSAPAGSGEVDLEEFREAVDLLRITSLGGKRDCERHGTFPHDFDRSLAKADRLLALIDSHAALLRKLQQGADYVVVPRTMTHAMLDAAMLGHDDVEETWEAILNASQGQEGGANG